MSYDMVEYRNYPWDYYDERNASFGDEWRNAWVTRRDPRTGRYSRVWVADQPMFRPITQQQPVTQMVQQPVQPMESTQPKGNITCNKSPFRNEMGQIRTGLIVDAIAQTIAAFASLPAAPEPTRDTNTDQVNTLTYLTALAKHAKADERIRTISKLIQLFVNN
mgnify:FL=1